MSKLVLLALLGMVALAAAVEVETQKKHYKDYEEKEEKHDAPHNYIVVKHKEWEWEEKTIKTHPCAEEYEILGSTVAQSNELLEDGKVVGKVYWGGIVVEHELCAHCKDYKKNGHHIVKVTYEVIFEIEGKGQIISKVVASSIFSEETTILAVSGGTGHFVGAHGTITWTYGHPSKYYFDIYVPKVHSHKDYDYDKYDKEYKY